MTDARSAFRVIEEELNSMSQEERVAYLENLGFALKPKCKIARGNHRTPARTKIVRINRMSSKRNKRQG